MINPQSHLVPMVIEQTPRGERFRHLFAPAQGQHHFHRDSDRRHSRQPRRRADAVPRIGGPGREISQHINSPGGSVTAGMAIYDTMQFVRCPVTTFCIGQCASMAAVLLCGE